MYTVESLFNKISFALHESLFSIISIVGGLIAGLGGASHFFESGNLSGCFSFECLYGHLEEVQLF